MAPFIPSMEQLLRVALKGLGGATRALNTVQHHDLHHRFPAHHFSLYFTHWDRWCGTMYPKYDKELFTYFS
jgi:lathosterol oxidase